MDGQCVSLLLDLWLLILHHIDKELLLETREGHSEVDDCQLDASFGEEVRIRQLGRNQESEVFVVDQTFALASKVDFLDAVLFVNRLVEDRIEAWVQVFSNFFKEYGLSILNGVLKLLLGAALLL